MTDSLKERYRVNKILSGIITFLFCLVYYMCPRWGLSSIDNWFFSLAWAGYSFEIASFAAGVIVTVILFAVTWSVVWTISYKVANFISKKKDLK